MFENFKPVYLFEVFITILLSLRTSVQLQTIFSERERGENKERGDRDRERDRRHRSRSRERRKRTRSRSKERRDRKRSTSPKKNRSSRRRKPSLYWDVPPPGFEHITPLQVNPKEFLILN